MQEGRVFWQWRLLSPGQFCWETMIPREVINWTGHWGQEVYCTFLEQFLKADVNCCCREKKRGALELRTEATAGGFGDGARNSWGVADFSDMISISLFLLSKLWSFSVSFLCSLDESFYDLLDTGTALLVVGYSMFSVQVSNISTPLGTWRLLVLPL